MKTFFKHESDSVLKSRLGGINLMLEGDSFGVSVSQLLLSGKHNVCFIPVRYLPEVVEWLSSFLPEEPDEH